MFVSVKDPLWSKISFEESATIRDVIGYFEANGFQAALILNSQDSISGTVSDGDIRRALYSGISLDVVVTEIMCTNPRTVSNDTEEYQVFELMKRSGLAFIPSINDKGALMGCWLNREVYTLPSLTNKVVIMAGGLGSRLGNLTATRPKPLLEIGGQPIIERIINSAKSSGFKNFIISVNYLAQSIKKEFGNGKRLGVNIDYVHEDSPLGTAGSLALIKNDILAEDFIVINCDVLTQICLRKLLQTHQAKKADATMVVAKHSIVNPYGTVEIAGDKLISFHEKPVYESLVNAGIYVLSPSTLNLLEKNVYCNMPSLFERVIEKGDYASVFPLSGGWIDIGQPDDLARARRQRFDND